LVPIRPNRSHSTKGRLDVAVERPQGRYGASRGLLWRAANL